MIIGIVLHKRQFIELSYIYATLEHTFVVVLYSIQHAVTFVFFWYYVTYDQCKSRHVNDNLTMSHFREISK